ncbi:MAG: hypothetical protein DSZ34_01300 [Gammaproteobacteria bacterium]|nr:MAG: hypothetical protein DSZ34_01300 [Gammaproteobacteria bacterium]
MRVQSKGPWLPMVFKWSGIEPDNRSVNVVVAGYVEKTQYHTGSLTASDLPSRLPASHAN